MSIFRYFDLPLHECRSAPDLQRQADWELLLEQSQERMAMQLDAATHIQKVSMLVQSPVL